MDRYYIRKNKSKYEIVDTFGHFVVLESDRKGLLIPYLNDLNSRKLSKETVRIEI